MRIRRIQLEKAVALPETDPPGAAIPYPWSHSIERYFPKAEIGTSPCDSAVAITSADIF